MKVILLGTGCPVPNLTRSGPSQLISAGEEFLLIDCGDGTLTQLIRAGIDPTPIRYLFFTHHHFDHNVGYASFVLTSWILGRRHLHVYGPRGTTYITDLLFKNIFKDDINSRISIGRPIEGILDIETTEIGEGVVWERNGCKVMAAKVPHAPFLDSFAYRIEYNGKSIVISGDTTYCEALIKLAEDADILVQGCGLFIGPGERFQQGMTPELWEKLHRWHATPEQVGEMASKARVRTLVLSHLPPTTDLYGLIEAHSKVFKGKIVVGEDLAEIEC